jgi:hypothetical protein
MLVVEYSEAGRFLRLAKEVGRPLAAFYARCFQDVCFTLEGVEKRDEK